MLVRLGAGVLLAIVGVVAYLVVAEPAGGEDDLPAAVRAELAVRARDAIEGGATWPYLDAQPGRLACDVRVFGADPPALTAADQARSVYVWADCVTLGTEVRSESLVPAAVHLTDPPTVEVPGPGSLYGPDVERIFPERLRDSAFPGS